MGWSGEPPRWLCWVVSFLGLAAFTWGVLVVLEVHVVTSTPDTPPFIFTPLVMSSLPGGLALLGIGGAALLRRRRT